VQHALARPDLTVPVLYTCVVFVIFCDLRFGHILMIFLRMHLVHAEVLHVHSLRLALQCYAFI